MRLTEFLSPSVMRVPLSARSKRGIVEELAGVLCPTAETAEVVVRSVMERERLMSSGIGQGIGMPHGFSPPSLPFAVALGVAVEPVDFDAIDGKPVTLVFLVVSDEEHISTKIRALARISRLLHREPFRHALASARSPAEAMQAIEDEEARHRI
jgi:mannitol/fructose-specific phosphotransferase system IIA component (Ntr-type)